MAQRKATEPTQVLILDDEPALVGLMKTFLERQQYRVETATSVESGLAIYNRDPSRYAVLIADLSLFGNDAVKTFVAILEADANSRILICSGYPFATAALAPEMRVRCGFLQKPFLPAMLVQAVEELLKR